MSNENCSTFTLGPIPSDLSPEPISVCKCLSSTEPSEQDIVPKRKQLIFSTVTRTEDYIKQRRIPELIKFILTKIIASGCTNPASYTEKLLDQCMMFRAGVGVAPVLYEDRHLEAVVKSFDPSQRGWLSAGQVRRAFTTLGLPPKNNLDERIPTDVVLESLRTTQERELHNILSAHVSTEESIVDDQSTSTK